MPVPESERSLAASANAHLSWAMTDNRAARTAPARAGLYKKFLELADGDPVRAESLRKAHYKNLALASARSRRKAREHEAAAEAAETELATQIGGPDAAA